MMLREQWVSVQFIIRRIDSLVDNRRYGSKSVFFRLQIQGYPAALGCTQQLVTILPNGLQYPNSERKGSEHWRFLFYNGANWTPSPSEICEHLSKNRWLVGTCCRWFKVMIIFGDATRRPCGFRRSQQVHKPIPTEKKTRTDPTVLDGLLNMMDFGA